MGGSITAGKAAVLLASLLLVPLLVYQGHRMVQNGFLRASAPQDPALSRKAPRRTLPEHCGYVSAVAFSPDGKLLATTTGPPKNIVLLWDTSSWQIVRKIPLQDNDQPTYLRFSPNGRLLAVGTLKGQVGLWDPQTGKLIRQLKGVLVVYALSFTPDGTLIAACNIGDGCVWEVASGRLVHHLSLGGEIDFSPDGKLLAGAPFPDDREVELLDTRSWQHVKTLTGHRSYVVSVKFSPNGKLLATGSGDKTARLWDVQTGKQRFKLTGHRAGVYSLGFSPDGKILAAAGDWRTHLWSTRTGRKIETLTGPDGIDKGRVHSLAISPDGKTLAVGHEAVVELWDLPAR